MIKLKSNFRLTQYCRNRGFTMIELMITVTVLAILTAVALPFYSSFTAGQRIKTASFDMMSQLTLVRSEAVKRNSNVTISATTGTDWKSGWTVQASQVTTTITLSQQAALTGLSIDCWTGSTATTCPASITYGNNGQLTASSPSFRIFNTSNTTSANTRCIGIDLSGRPNSKKGDC